MNTNRSRLGAATLLLPAVLALGACGKSADPAPAAGRRRPTTSAAATTPAPDASATTSAATGGTNGAAPTDKASFIAALKAATADVKTVHVSMGLDGAGQTMSMEGDSRTDPKDPAVKLTMSASGLDLDMVLIDKKIYIKGIPGQGDAKRWAGLRREQHDRQAVRRVGRQARPDGHVRGLRQGRHRSQAARFGDVDGEQLEKYELTLDTTKMAGVTALPDASAKLPATLTYTAWLDADNRMRRVVFDVSGVKATMKLSKYGEAVDITAPPAAQVVKGSM